MQEIAKLDKKTNGILVCLAIQFFVYFKLSLILLAHLSVSIK